ncbi:ribonuclease P protein component [Buchnera aphidicola]|uniref:Ribonuclease P protein component n=1 Tax=Buchnera aphidicola (Aphis gossypii) TaxID=98785 RepID=A0A5J6Z8S1_9GAMM|nr:ribonuclease P protein component [Buchnera aphidicola]QFQ31874.1 ribonuclease P protein component [Buchnera aphidicola (Aphis gossypii)]UPT14406.1 ribonuclease P protein component [Buchnera aphidicola (Aphis gossypii)]
MLNYFFKKKSRLLKPINFEYVFKKNCVQKNFELTILGRPNLLGYPRLGINIPRKNIKYAYKRNIIKRLIRETFRLLQHKLTSMDFVVIAQKNVIFLKNKNVINILENLWLKYRQ